MASKESDGICPTRFPELGYRQDDRNCWRIYDLSDRKPVGAPYRTKAELLADLERYAEQFGCGR